MRAALSLSISRVVGQKASEPSLFEILLIGAPSLSTHPYILSKPAFPPVLVLPQRACVCTILKPGVAVATVQGYEGAGVLNRQQDSYYTLKERSRNGCGRRACGPKSKSTREPMQASRAQQGLEGWRPVDGGTVFCTSTWIRQVVWSPPSARVGMLVSS